MEKKIKNTRHRKYDAQFKQEALNPDFAVANKYDKLSYF